MNIFMYPSKKFTKKIFIEINKGINFQIHTDSKWRCSLIKMAINYWPKFKDDTDFTKGNLFFKIRYELLLFPLMSVHVWAIAANYIMGYRIIDEKVELHYSNDWIKNKKFK